MHLYFRTSKLTDKIILSISDVVLRDRLYRITISDDLATNIYYDKYELLKISLRKFKLFKIFSKEEYNNDYYFINYYLDNIDDITIISIK
jgi:hypothetical protein